MGNERLTHTPEINIRLFEIERTLDELPETSPCMVCDEPSVRTLISFEQPFTTPEGKQEIARSDVPGYLCGNCGTQTYDLKASIQAVEGAMAVALKSGDYETVKDLSDALIAGIRQIEFFKKEIS